MAKSFKYFADKFEAYKKAKKPEQNQGFDPRAEELIVRLTALADRLTMLLLQKEMTEVKSSLSKLALGDKLEANLKERREEPKDNTSEKPELTHKEALGNLEKVATNRKLVSGQREYLLHRPTVDFEYEKSAVDGKYETTENTEWVAEYMPAEGQQNGANPVMSIWVNEKDVVEIPFPHVNSGTWGELGKNPFASRYKAIVGPGIYEIYQELKKAKK